MENIENQDFRVALNIQISVSRALMQMIIDRFGFCVESLNVQQYALIQLYIEEIEIAESVACLIENKKSFGIETLTRSFSERYIYMNAVVSDENMAKAYLMCSLFENVKLKRFKGKYHGLRSYVPEDWWKLFSDAQENNKEFVDSLEKTYSNLFKDPSTKRIWYSIDGKTTTIDKLVKKLGIRDFESYVYYLYSLESHGMKAQSSVEEVLYSRTYPLKNKPVDFNLLFYLTGYLIQMRTMINDCLRLDLKKPDEY